jgi:hypothetical protein
MTCVECGDTGLIPYLPLESPKALFDAEQDDLHFAVCLCDTGEKMREDTNQGRKVAPQWQLWCARFQVQPERVRLCEYVFSAEDLKAAGLVPLVPATDRHAALLATGKKAKR